MAERELVTEHMHCYSRMWPEHADTPKRYSEVQGEKGKLLGLGTWAATLHRSWQNSSYLEMSELGYTDLTGTVLESHGNTACVLKCTTFTFMHRKEY